MFHDLSGKEGSLAPALTAAGDIGLWTLDITAS